MWLVSTIPNFEGSWSFVDVRWLPMSDGAFSAKGVALFLSWGML